MNLALLLFVKNPVLGTVKTRLAQTTGDEFALAAYRVLLTHTRKVTEAVDVTRYLFYASTINEHDEWSADRFEKRVQPNGNLGDRMRAAFEEVLAKHDAAIIIGSDCADLRPEHLERARTELTTHDAVIGPVFDGGYYLLGLKNPLPDVFSGIEWSTETVFRETARRLVELERTFATLPTLHDVDYEEDWVRTGWTVEEDDLPKSPR